MNWKIILISLVVVALALLCFLPILKNRFTPADPCCADETNDKPIVACKLNSAEQVKRSKEIKQELLSKSTDVNELTDGFEWIFDASDETANQLIDFVNFERDCCAFFTFTMIFPPDKKIIRLQITGEKDILKSDFFQDK
ncbi:hypothetical protein K1X84_09780 [bacterium]|nr:hypothetical protein [bacterium]